MQLFLDQDKKPGLFNKYKPENIVQDNLMLKYYGEHPPLPVAATSAPTNVAPITSNGRTVNGGVPFNQLSNYARSKEVGPVNQQQVQDIQNINQGYQGINQKVEQSYRAIVDANHTNTIMQANLLAKGDLNNYDEYGNYHPPTIDNYDKAVSYIQNAAHKNFYTQTPYGNIKTGPMGIQPPPMLKGSDYKNMMRPEGPQYINDYESWTRQQQQHQGTRLGPRTPQKYSQYNITIGDKTAPYGSKVTNSAIVNTLGITGEGADAAVNSGRQSMYQDPTALQNAVWGAQLKLDTLTPMGSAMKSYYNAIGINTGVTMGAKLELLNHYKIGQDSNGNDVVKPVGSGGGTYNNSSAKYFTVIRKPLTPQQYQTLSQQGVDPNLIGQDSNGYYIKTIGVDKNKLTTTINGRQVFDKKAAQNLLNIITNAANTFSRRNWGYIKNNMIKRSPDGGIYEEGYRKRRNTAFTAFNLYSHFVFGSQMGI